MGERLKHRAAPVRLGATALLLALQLSEGRGGDAAGEIVEVGEWSMIIVRVGGAGDPAGKGWFRGALFFLPGLRALPVERVCVCVC